MTPVLVICSLTIVTKCGLSAALPRGNTSAVTKPPPLRANLRPVTHHCVPASFNDERGVRVAQADNLFCHWHFLLLHDASFANVGGLFESRYILRDEAQGLLPLQSPTRWQIGAPLKVAANRLQIAQQTFAQPAHSPQ